MIIDRRDFLKTGALASVTLFLPKFIRPRWRPTTPPPIPWDYQIALVDSYGKEFTGKGYTRMRGRYKDDFQLRSSTALQQTATLIKTTDFSFAPEHWGTLDRITSPSHLCRAVAKPRRAVWMTTMPIAACSLARSRVAGAICSGGVSPQLQKRL